MDDADIAAHLDQSNDPLTGTVALVTGAGTSGGLLGTGVATALLFASRGAYVGVLDADAERAKRTLELVRANGGDGCELVADITDSDAVEAAVAHLAAQRGRIDTVVNNAAITNAGPDAKQREQWDRVIAVNVIGTMLVSEAATPHLRGRRGSIVNVSSIAALRSFGFGPYSASKSALITMTADLAYALGPAGIRVNCIVVGHIHAPMGAFGDDTQRDLRRRANVLGTEGDAWDVARAALFLAGPDARWITGVALPVDAGTTLATGLGMFGRMSEPPPD